MKSPKQNGNHRNAAAALAADAGDDRYVLRLYIAGMTPRSALAVERTKAICERYLAGRHELVVIDLYQQPQLARQDQVVAAPTLVKESPRPLRRIIGDMADEPSVLKALNLWK